jgi:hypothetical protein
MTTEEKILQIISKHLLTSQDIYVAMNYSAKDIAAMIEPYQKLIDEQDEYIKIISDAGCMYTIKECEIDNKIDRLRKEIKK